MDLTYINVGSVALALALTLVNNRLIEYFVTPIFLRQGWDKGLILYVSAGTGLVLALLANVDLFMPGLWVHPLVSKILSSIIIAGGSNLIHDIVGSPQQQRYTRSGIQKVRL